MWVPYSAPLANVLHDELEKLLTKHNKEDHMKKILFVLLITSMPILNLYAQPGHSTIGTSPSENMTETPGTMDSMSRPSQNVPTTNTQRTDEVKSIQSGTTKESCINVEAQGRLCGVKATKWCKDHQDSMSCRNIQKSNSTTTPAEMKNY